MASHGPVVIVGASLAGLRTAEALRRVGHTGDVIVIGDEPRMPYNRPPLSKDALADGTEDAVLDFPIRGSIADVEWRIGTRVTGLDTRTRTVRTDRGDTVPYGSLVIASGVRARTTPSPAAPRSRFRLRTLDDAISLRAALTPGARVLVVGAGFLGCEIAASARRLGCEVTVVMRTTEPMQRVLGAELAGAMRRVHEREGVRFVSSPAVRLDELAPRVVLHDGVELEGDLLVEAIGTEPNTDWLDESRFAPGLPVVTDDAMRARGRDGAVVHDVYAVGDVAAFPSVLEGGRPRAVEHWNMPAEMARRAAATIVARTAGGAVLDAVLDTPFAAVPSFWTDQYDLHLLSYGEPALAERAERLHGEADGEAVYGYFRGDALVGVSGIGMRSTLLGYRSTIAEARLENARLLDLRLEGALAR